MKNLIAIGFMLAASLFFACSTVLVKGIGRSNFGEGVHPILIAYARFFFSFIFLTIVCCFIRPKIESLNKRLHFFRSCFGCLGVSILFTAVLYIPISDATAITFLNPIFAMFLRLSFLRKT